MIDNDCFDERGGPTNIINRVCKMFFFIIVHQSTLSGNGSDRIIILSFIINLKNDSLESDTEKRTDD